MPVVSSSVPASLPPSGTAGGDLAGTYPSPTVAKVNGVGVTGTAASGKVIQASSASAASWQTPVTGIPQGGPLTEALVTNEMSITGDDPDTAFDTAKLTLEPGANASATLLAAWSQSGQAGTVTVSAGHTLAGGSGAVVHLYGGNTDGTNGRLDFVTNNSHGTSGQAMVSDGSGLAVWGGLTIAAGVPAGAPAGKLPFAFDTTAVTGGAYYWNGAAWVKFANII